MFRKLGSIAFALSLVGFAVLGYLEISARLSQQQMKSLWGDTDNRGNRDRSPDPNDPSGNEGFRPLEIEKRGPNQNQLGVLRIPKIGVDHVVLYDSTVENLRLGPALIKETEYPGRRGNAVIAGHRTTYGFPFRRLNELKKGDKIIFKNGSGEVVYRVTKTLHVDPQDTEVLKPTKHAQITLSTCDPPFAATYRLIVVGRAE